MAATVTRSAARVLGVYVTAGFAWLQVLDILATRLDLSDRFFLLTLLCLAPGLPLVGG